MIRLIAVTVVLSSTFFFFAVNSTAQTVPELIYYKFDGTGATVPNLALTPVGVNPASIVTHTQGGAGQFGGALLGGGTGGRTNSGFATNITTDWTLSFWIDFGSVAGTFQYFFGDNSASNWRMFANGAAGVGNVVMAKTGFTNTVAFGVADGNPHVVHYVWEAAAGNLKAYVDGVLSNTVAQSSGAITGGTGLMIGGNNTGALLSGAKMDEFRLYNRALSQAEITQVWNNSLPLASAENDAGVVSIDGPNNCEGINQVQATIKNHGINQVNSVMVKWEVNGLPQPDVIYNNVLDTFGGVFPQSAQIVLGDVTLINGLTTDIVAWTEMPNNQIDTVTENDTAYKTIDALPTISAFPFSENFEGGQGDWFIDGTNSSWAFGTPAKTTISGASSGVNAFVTGGLGTGFHNDDEKSYVNSPCFDLSGFEGTPWVALDVWWNIELGWDGAALQATTDGNNWQTVGKTDDPYNWYTDSTLEGKPGDQDHGWSGRTSEANTGSGGWVNAKHGLDESFVDQVVRFRVAMGSDAATVDDGIAFDDFRIVDYKNANLGPDKRSLCQTSSMSLDPEVNFNGKIWWSTLDSTNQTIVVTTTGSYWVTYTDTLIDLTSTDTVEIIQSPPLVIDWAPYEDTIYKDNISTLNPRLPLDVDYTWTPGGYTFPFYVVRGSEFAPGTHQFKLNVVDSVLCSDEKSVTVVILDALGVGTYGSGLVKMYPNPTRDFINIELIGIEGAMQLQMTDVNGRIVRDEVIRASTGQKIQVDISNLVSGSYIVRLVNDNGVLIHKIIKE